MERPVLAALSSPFEAMDFLETELLPLWRVYPTPSMHRRALQSRDRYKSSFYDALIVAAALEAGCGRLLTEDLQHGQQIEELVVENPFLT